MNTQDILEQMREATRRATVGGNMQFLNVADELRRFRMKLESESDGVSICEIETNATMLLSDLACHLGLSAEQHDEVIGAAGCAFLEAMLNTPIKMTAAH